MLLPHPVNRSVELSDPSDSLPKHKNDFGQVYDLEDPSPYFTALQPADYRMPEVLARTLTAIHDQVTAARRRDRSNLKSPAAPPPARSLTLS